MQKRNTMGITDIFNKPKFGIGTYSKYDILHNQDTNELCRFPELFPLFDYGYCIEYASNWKFFRITRRHYACDALNKPEELKLFAKCLYNAFHDNPLLAIVLNTNAIEVRSTTIYIEGSFEVFRNNELFKVREFLSLPHTGLGKDSLKLKEIK